MANLLGQNIGTNYKGILNLNTLNGNLSGTLESVTDGDGNASPLRLSTSQIRIDANNGFSQFWFNTSGTANNRNVGVYQIGSSWSLFSRNDANNAGEEFLNATFASSNLSTLTLGKTTTPLILSLGLATLASSNFVLGHTSASARLHVRGDGTNPIARFENSSGSSAWAITATGSALTCESQARIQGPAIANDSSVVLGSFNNLTTTTLTQTILTTQGNIVCAAGSGNKRISSIEYGINNSGAQTGTATGIFLNATETALNGMTHNLMDLQRGGVSQFSVTRDGAVISAGGTSVFPVARMGFINDPTNAVSVFSFANTTGATTFGGSIFRFNLATNAAPALKRNGAALEVRLADDSATTALNAASFNTVSCTIGSNFMSIGGDSGFLRPAASTIAISLNGFSNNHFEFRKNSDTTVVGIIKGTGSPEGVITANQGSIFLRTDGGAGTSFYVKESGTGNTGWVAK